jgi:hypothetical protein
MHDEIRVRDGVHYFRPGGPHTLVTAVDLIREAIGHCRTHAAARLLVNATAMTGISPPSLIDRFLAAEDWAQAASGEVAVALVIHTETIHPQKFGVRVARDLGLMLDVFDDEAHADRWLRMVPVRD